MPTLELQGCGLEPLGDYLKALGIFRVVAEQIDPGARCWWKHGIFHLWLTDSATYSLDRDRQKEGHRIPTDTTEQAKWLETFFLEYCVFTPLIAPWQKNTGYLAFDRETKAKKQEKATKEGKTTLERARGLLALRTITNSHKFAPRDYQRTIRHYAQAFGRTLPDLPGASWVDELANILDDELFAGLNSNEQGKKQGLKSATVARLLDRTRNACASPLVSAWLDVVGHPERVRSGFGQRINWFSLLGEGAGEGSGGMIVTLEVALADVMHPAREANWQEKKETKKEGARSVLTLDYDAPKNWLRASLFASPTQDGFDDSYSIGLFYPSRKGDPNLGQSFEGSRRGSAWDVIFLFEGVLLFAGGLSRQLNAHRAVSAFPFYCHSSLGGNAAGAGNEIEGSEKGISSGEVWCPVWSQPATLRDLTAVFSEGRMQVGGRDARLATQFIRALGQHGCDRGIAAFQRYGLLRRSGSFGKQDQTSTLAVPLGLYTPKPNSNLALLDEFFDFEEAVLDAQGRESRRLQAVTDIPSRPRRLIAARQAFEDALFATSRSGIEEQKVEAAGGVTDFQNRLVSVALSAARLEREFAVTAGRIHNHKGEMPDTNSKGNAPTAPVLSFDWLRLRRENADQRPRIEDCPGDGSAEWNLARAVGTIGAWGKASGASRRSEPAAVGPIRENLVPVSREWDRESRSWGWAWEGESRRAVWSGAHTILENFAMIAQRRLIDAERGSGRGLPVFSCYGAAAGDLLALWQDGLSESRLSELIHAFALIRSWKRPGTHDSVVASGDEAAADDSIEEADSAGFRKDDNDWQTALGEYAQLPRAYALLKLCFLGWKLPPRPGTRRTGDEPFPSGNLQMLNLLLARRGEEACDLASRRLFIAGYPPLFFSGRFAPSEFELPDADWPRLAGLFLIPIRHPSALCHLIIKPTTETNP